MVFIQLLLEDDIQPRAQFYLSCNGQRPIFGGYLFSPPHSIACENCDVKFTAMERIPGTWQEWVLVCVVSGSVTFRILNKLFY